MTLASFSIRVLVPGGIALGVIASAACGGSVSDNKPIDIAPEAGPPPRPPPPTDAGIDAPDPNERDFHTTLVADEAGAEVQIAVSSTGRIVVAWIGIGGGAATIRYAISDDNGLTFSAAKTAGNSVGDPIVAALPDGSFLVGGLRADCSGGIDQCANGEIFVARIAPGASTHTLLPSIFEPPNNAFIDHPWMSVHGTDVSIIGAAFPLVAGNYQSGMTAWKSIDQGQSWTRSEIVTASASAVIGIPRFCAGDGNRLFAHFYDGTSSTQGTLRFTDTTDDGWTAANKVDVGGASAGIVSEGACVVKGDSVYALLGVDVTTGGGGAGDSVTPVFSDIHLVVSDDLGKTWNDRATIGKSGSQYLLPEINLEPDGTVDVFYYRGEKLDGAGTAEMVRITGGGTTVGKPFIVRDGLVFVNDRGSQRWLGDYNGIGIVGGRPAMAFGDNATTKTKVRFGVLKN